MTTDSLPPNLRPDAFVGAADAFVGAAADYMRYRLPYPEPLLQSFLARAALPARGAKLIDLACGPGRVTLAIADRFDEILAVDREPEMIEAAQREAARRGIPHIRWSVGRAEDFAAPAGRFDLVTIGEAFHRVDRKLVSAKAFGWLKPGGLFVTLGVESFLHGSAPWRRILADVVRSYVGWPAERLGGNPNPARRSDQRRTSRIARSGLRRGRQPELCVPA